MSAPDSRRRFADFAAGEAGLLGQIEITEAAVVAFALAYDPQPFHLDPEAGRASPLGGHAASGWHTASLMMRLIVDGLLVNACSMGSGGVRDLKWLKPVLVGDHLTARYEILETRLSRKGDRGRLDIRFLAENQSGDLVFEMTGGVMIEV